VLSDDDCSAQNRPRKLKLVLLESPGNEDSEYVQFLSHVLCLATPFSTVVSFFGGGGLWDKWARRGSGNYQQFMHLMKMIDSSQPPVTHMRFTLSDFFFTHSTIKRTHRMAFEKNA
jgi:hypothetical protein